MKCDTCGRGPIESGAMFSRKLADGSVVWRCHDCGGRPSEGVRELIEAVRPDLKRHRELDDAARAALGEGARHVE